MRQSFLASALCLSLTHSLVTARAHDKVPQLKIRNGQPVVEPSVAEGVSGWAQSLVRRFLAFRVQSGTCYEDPYYSFMQDLDISESFCQGYMEYPNETVYVNYTPTSTYTYTFTTQTYTDTELTRSTPVRTVTVTESSTPMAKREAHPEITQRAALDQAEIAQVFAMYRRQNGDDSSTGTLNDTASMSSAFSSACSCQNYGGSTITETYTEDPSVITLSAFGVTTTTTTTTDGARATTTTITVPAPPPMGSILSSPTAAPASSANATPVSSTTTSMSEATPTSPPVICPDNDGDVVSQLVNAERFDYLVNCSTDLTSPNFYPLYYSTFGQCVSACSYADANFGDAVCQGISYYGSLNVDGYNCFLKTSGNGSVSMPGVDSATLLRVVMGVDSADPNGTTTEAQPFGGVTSTQDLGSMSSSMSAVMGNSTSTMPMITPGPPMPQSGLLVNAGGFTSYTTVVSDGSTYSTGTVYSTYYSNSGVWYYSYYTSYSLQWASATTEYAVGAQETQIAATNNTSTSQSSGDNGGYYTITDSNSTSYFPGGYNVTEVISNQTYAANGSEISSTATTNYYSYQTGGGSSGSSGSGNGSVESSAGGVTSTSLYSTQTVIYNFGATGGASGYVASGSIGAPSTSATTIYASGGTAYSSGYVISGGDGGAGGASGYAASGSITSMPESTVTVITVTNGTAYSSGYAASGSIGGAGGASGYAGSGSIMSLPNSTSAAVIMNTGGTAYSSGFVASGSIGGTGGTSGTAASGSISSSESPVTTPNAPRTGEYSTTSPGTAPIGTGSTFSASMPPAYPSFSGSMPLSSVSTPLTDTGNRTGSQSPPLSTGPAPYPPTLNLPRTGEYSTTSSPPFVSFPTGYPPFIPGSAPSSGLLPSQSTNETISLVTGTAPVSTPDAPHTGEFSTTSPSLSGYFGYSTPNAPRTGEYSTTSPSGPASSGSSVPSSNETIPLVPTAPLSYPSIPISSGSPVPSSNSTDYLTSGAPRTGSQGPSSFFPTGTSPPLYTIPTPPPPYVPASCSNYTMGTMTVFVTTTELGCYSSCVPQAGGYSYGGGPPQAFGPGGSGWGSPPQLLPAAEASSTGM